MSEDTPRNNVAPTRGRPFALGNPGRPRGSRNRATLAVQALLEGEADLEALSRKIMEQALAGNALAQRLWLERIAPPRRDQPINFPIPPLETLDDAKRARALLVEAVASGRLLSSEADDIARQVVTTTTTTRSRSDVGREVLVTVLRMPRRFHPIRAARLAPPPSPRAVRRRPRRPRCTGGTAATWSSWPTERPSPAGPS